MDNIILIQYTDTDNFCVDGKGAINGGRSNWLQGVTLLQEYGEATLKLNIAGYFLAYGTLLPAAQRKLIKGN